MLFQTGARSCIMQSFRLFLSTPNLWGLGWNMLMDMEIRSQIADGRLVELARGGESAAFDALVGRFQRAVHAVAFAVVSDSEAALDVLQDSFITAYRRLRDLDDPARFGPWVCGIARNRAKQVRRDHWRRESREVPMPESMPVPGHLDEGIERVREALSVLTELQADVVALFYMEGYSIAECAHLLDVPEGTVKRRLHDARQRLKKEMTDMVKQQLPEFALPEDYRVVINKATPIHTTRPSLVCFKGRWVLLWQDGVPWEPYDGPFWFWLSESEDGKTWSEPRKLDLPKSNDEMRYHPDYLQLMNACVVGDRLFFLTQQFMGHMDLYSSEDTVNWTTHPRLRMGMTSRGSLFGSGDDLYMIYPSILFAFGLGNRVDLIRSSDGGQSWTWLNSPFWGNTRIWDAAGAVVDGRIHVAWREIAHGTWSAKTYGAHPSTIWVHSDADPTMDKGVPDGDVTQSVYAGSSDDGGQTWGHRVWQPQEYPANSGLTIQPLPGKSEPCRVELLDVAKPRISNSLQIASHGDTLAIAEEVQTDYYNSEVWVAISRDGGRTWPEKATYSPGALREPAIAFASDGTLLLAGSSRTGEEARPWVVHSRITD